MEQFSICTGKCQCNGVLVDSAFPYKLNDQTRIIRRVTKYTSRPRLYQAVVFNGEMSFRRIPRTIHW